MIGSRPLTSSEVSLVSARLAPRDRAMFILGLRTGFRISEILSLKVSDVRNLNGEIVTAVSVSRCNMKGKVSGRTVALHREARQELELLCKSCRQDDVLFPIGRMQAWRILNNAYQAAGVYGKLGTHAMRKTFANRVYEKLGKDLLRTQKALGHVSISSTVSYLAFADSEVDAAILGV